LQQQLNDRDVDQVVDLVTIGLLDNDLIETTHLLNGIQNAVGLQMVGGPS
jgi:hypothetical protein